MSITRRNFVIGGAVAAAASILVPKLEGMSGAQKTREMAAPPSRARSTKKGLAGIAPLKSKLVTHWYYDWRLHPAMRGMPSVDPTILFYPMCWGWKPARAAGTAHANSQSTASKPTTDDSSPEGLMHLKAQNPKLLFGFNEPDHVDQSNLSVEDAVRAWPALQGVAQELVGPSCANPMGDWMAKFVAEIERQNLQMDALGFHSYGSPAVEPFVHKLEAFYARYKRPVWVTEFAVADWAAKDGKAPNRYSVEQVAEFMQGACAYMEKTSWIRGYAWFPTKGKHAAKEGGGGPLATSVLYEADGSLNQLGRLYNSL